MTEPTLGKWEPITGAHYWDMLECVPPAYMRADSFLMGEPYDHEDDGWPRFHAFRKVRNDHYQFSVPVSVRQFPETLRLPVGATTTDP